jgi:ABC-type Fe3+-siderophore transport system permease subunit
MTKDQLELIDKKSLRNRLTLEYVKGLGMGMMLGAITFSYFNYSETVKLYLPIVGVILAAVCIGISYFYYDRKKQTKTS